MRGEWIEILEDTNGAYLADQSLPMRGEWIEMRKCYNITYTSSVSPHAGRVD